jgi:hypothetical protein
MIDLDLKFFGYSQEKLEKILRMTLNKISNLFHGAHPTVLWTAKTVKARKTSRIIDTSIIKKSIEMNIRIKFLIFGPGKNSKEYKTHRLAVKKLIENVIHQKADFPEDLNIQSNSPITNDGL